MHFFKIGLSLFACAVLFQSGQAIAEQKPEQVCGHVNPAQSHYSEPICLKADIEPKELCTLIGLAADKYNLPKAFLARLLWVESRFDPMARSPKGAMGIAQFIQSTAKLRDLDDPYHPVKAINRSAHYLDELRNRFGNLGMAAVAYNGGEGRANRYKNIGGSLPYETERYVILITGKSAQTWREQKQGKVDFKLSEDKPFQDACVALARSGKIRKYDYQERPLHTKYSVVLASHFREGQASRLYASAKHRHSKIIGDSPKVITRGRTAAFGRRLQFFAGVGKNSQKDAINLCRSIRKSGGFCKVVRVH